MAGRKILKYQLKDPDHDKVYEFSLPPGAQILIFREQNNLPCLWVAGISVINKDAVKFRLVADSCIIKPNETYIGTAICPPLLWHLVKVNP